MTDGAITWEPKHDQLVVRPLTPADRTAGGVIVIPDAHRERPMQGVVLAVGPGVWQPSGDLLKPTSEVGDLVLFGKYAGMDFDVDGRQVLIMRDVEALLRKRAGSYELVEHDGGKHAHVAGYLCEHCPATKSALVEAERERLREDRRRVEDEEAGAAVEG